MNVSPLRYPGGKTRACKKLDEIVQNNFDITSYKAVVSPFFGGGSFEFHLQNNYNLPLIVNDKFTPLFNFWSTAKKNKDFLVNELKKINVDKDMFTNFRETIFDDTSDVQAVKYFVINRSSFSGATLSGGFSLESSKKRFTMSSIERINNLDLSNVDFHNMDFAEFLSDEMFMNNFVFVDPPYYLESKSKLYGKNGDLHENFDHEKLFDILNKQKNWLLTYNDHPKIREMYKGMNIVNVDWKYGMNKNKESCEIVIFQK